LAGLELFGNQVSTTVTSGGATTPASGTSETWVVSSSSGFPAASSTASPPTFFRITDVALSSEKIIVTNVAGTTWTVTRGAEGTTPVLHSSGFTVQQVVTAAALEGFLQLSGGTMTGPVSGFTDKGSQLDNVKAYGATGNGQAITVSMSSGSAVVNAGAATFTSSSVDGGKLFIVYGAGLVPAPAAAPAPTTATAGGTVLAGTYGVKYTYVNAAGETLASAAGSVVTTGSTSTITVPSPPTQQTVTSWYAYVTAVNGSTYYRQQGSGSPTAIGTALTLTAPPTTSGANPPSSNTATGGTLSTTVSSVSSSTQATLAATAAVAVSGAVAVYGTDDTTAIQSALLGNGITYFPAGNYMISAALEVPNLISLVGEGCGYQYASGPPGGVNGGVVTCLVQTSLTANGLVTTATSGSPDSYAIAIRDLTLQGPGGGSGIGLTVQEYGGNQNVALYVERALISSWGSDGFNGQSLNFSSLRDVAFANNGGDGLNILSQGIDMSNLHSFSNQGDGYYFYSSAGVANMLFTNENAGSGIHVNQCGGMIFSGCTTENDSSINGATYCEGNCQGLTFFAHSTSYNKYIGLHLGPECYAVNVLSYTETVASGFAPTASFQADGGSSGFFSGPNIVTAYSIPSAYWTYDLQPGFHFGGALSSYKNILDDLSGNATIAGNLKLAAGTTSLPPLTLQAGTNLTAAAAGDFEYDGTSFYFTAAASSRQVVPAEQFQVLSSPYTLTASGSAQKLFNATTNGTLTVQGSTAYEFECLLNITGLSSSSHTIDFGFGGTASFTGCTYDAITATAAGGSASIFSVASASATAITAATTGTTLQALIRGTLRINGAGTIIPQITQVTANAAGSVAAGSRIRLAAIGGSTVTSVGDWS
jgi:Pectate lyase superfamily protein